jgi:hypothetical protein
MRYELGSSKKADKESELRDRDDIPLLPEGKKEFKLVWMESIYLPMPTH